MKAQKLKILSHKIVFFMPILLLLCVLLFGSGNSLNTNSNIELTGSAGSNTIKIYSGYGCGSTGSDGNTYGSAAVATSIDFGCQGNQCAKHEHVSYCSRQHNGIIDLLFAIIRFLSDGVGLVVILSVVIGGIQYTTSRGDPKATQAAVKRLTSALTALLIFIFAYALLNYVIPRGFFQQ